MKIQNQLTALKPHFEPKRPYGYTFPSIKVYKVTTENRIDLDLYEELGETHDNNNFVEVRGDAVKHVDRIIWEIARYIEGNFGCPYSCIIVERLGYITIHTPKDNQWWSQERFSDLSNFLMGLRSLFDLF